MVSAIPSRRKRINRMTANIITNWGNWISEFWALNVDKWIAAGWLILGTLTVIATLVMIVKIFKSNKELYP
jgi:hypothetical protein